MLSEVAYVIPTLGDRKEYLLKALESLRSAGVSNIVLVSPPLDFLTTLLEGNLVSSWVADPGTGITGAVNAGVESLPKEIQYVGWIGDDDLLYPQAAALLSQKLSENSDCELVYGYCDYIDANDRIIFTNRVGQLALFLLRWGPNLLPQPTTMYRRETFLTLGGLNLGLKWACDLDLFLRLSKVGKTRVINRQLAAFRWHPDSLTAGSRSLSVAEGSAVRKSHLAKPLRLICEIWELPVRQFSLIAGRRVSVKSRNKVVAE